jgi:prepilin-type N-terminal cleavage/methylation domain-containing protein
MNATRWFNIGKFLDTLDSRRVRARGLQGLAGIPVFCRPGPLTGRRFNQASRKSREAFTLVELLVVLAVVALLAVMLLPAIAATKPNSQAFQCMNNQRQITLAWLMYAEDNKDVLAPNDFPFTTAYLGYPHQSWMRNWVVGTMEQGLDAGRSSEFTDPNSVLSAYETNAAVYRCPADNYIDPNSHGLHVRSYSMNSAVGTIWFSWFSEVGFGPPAGSPVQGGWLPGAAYNSAQTTWLTYGKLSSFTKPGPANTFVIMEENPQSINDGSIAMSALAAPGETFLIDCPAGNHDGASCVSFADGHVIIHKWLDGRTFTPQGIIQPGMGSTKATVQTPDNPDCFYLAPITSAAR